jgi:pseudouridine kinase
MDKSNEYVVAIGGSNIDIIGQPYEKLLFKNSNKSKINLSSGGVIRNIAENLSKLNSNCHLITVFGDDDFGSFFKK